MCFDATSNLGERATQLSSLALRFLSNKLEKGLRNLQPSFASGNPSSLVTIPPQLSLQLSINAPPPFPPLVDQYCKCIASWFCAWHGIAKKLLRYCIAVSCINQLIKLECGWGERQLLGEHHADQCHSLLFCVFFQLHFVLCIYL